MSTLVLSVRLDSEPSPDDLLRMHALEAVAAEITGVPRTPLNCGLKIRGSEREISCSVHTERIPRKWIDDAQVLAKHRVIDGIEWYGEIEEPAKTKMRRFLLQGVERQFECTLYSNGCVSMNLDPRHYRIHFCSFEEFRSVHDESITWIDEAE